MRNLKKLLSVVLVVAMIAGLCAVGSFSAAAAEYSEVTNYKEAAAVITGVGIMKGYEDGTMQYDKTVTREEAAKIICMALIGVDTAEKLSTAVAPFADVAATRWSAPFINYLKAQGIVNGKTATQFDPTAEVTAVEFAKMMLCAVGYGKAGEFVGASWDVNTITAANNNGIYTGTLAADLTAPATREQCMLYAFNTMVRVPVVNYNSAFQSYYVGTSITSGLDGRVAENDIGRAADPEYSYTLAYRNFKLERLNAGNDDFGRPAVKWTSNGKAVVEEVSSKTADYVLNGTVSSGTLYNTVGAAIAKNINKQIWNDSVTDPAKANAFLANANKVIQIWKNGEQVPAAKYDSSDAMNAVLTAPFAGDSLTKNKVAGNGDITEIYIDTFESTDFANNNNPGTINTGVGDYNIRIVVTSEYFAQVTDVTASKLTLKVFKTNGNSFTAYANTGDFVATAKADDVNISGFAKKDYVLVNIHDPNGDKKVTKITAAKAPVVGTFDAFNSMFQNVIDGKGVALSEVVSYTATPKTKGGNLDAGSQYSFWYDSMGNVIYAELYQDGGSSDVSSYAYVRRVRCDSTSSNYDYAFDVELVYADGKSEWVNYNINKSTGEFKVGNTTYYAFTNSTSGTGDFYNVHQKKDHSDAAAKLDTIVVPGHFYRFTKGDNKVNLKPLDTNYANEIFTYDIIPAAGSGITFNPNTGITLGANYKSNNNTTVAIVDANGNVINLNGETKFDNKERFGAILYTYDKDSKKIKNVFLFSKGEIKSENKAYYVSAGNLVGDYGYVNLYINGAYVENAKVEKATYDMVTFFLNTTKVYDVTVTGDLYELNMITDGSVKNNASLATASDLTAYGYFNGDNFTTEYYYAWATIDEVGTHSFVTAEADVGSKEAGNYAGATATAHKFYFDSSTEIYDCTFAGGGKAVASVEAGQHFIAVLENNATYGPTYCSHIWIVG